MRPSIDMAYRFAPSMNQPPNEPTPTTKHHQTSPAWSPTRRRSRASGARRWRCARRRSCWRRTSACAGRSRRSRSGSCARRRRWVGGSVYVCWGGGGLGRERRAGAGHGVGRRPNAPNTRNTKNTKHTPQNRSATRWPRRWRSAWPSSRRKCGGTGRSGSRFCPRGRPGLGRYVYGYGMGGWMGKVCGISDGP